MKMENINQLKIGQASAGVFVLSEFMQHFTNISAAIVLSQLQYWYKAGKNGQPKLRVLKDGKHWLAKSGAELGRECGLSARAVEGAIKELVSQGIIEVKTFRFNCTPIRHIRVLEADGKASFERVFSLPKHLSKIQQEHESNTSHGVPDFTSNGSPNPPKVKSLTYTTKHILLKQKIHKPLATPESNQNLTSKPLPEEDINIEVDTGVYIDMENKAWCKNEYPSKTVSTSAEKLAGLKIANGKPPKVTSATICGQFYEVWRYEVPKHTSMKLVLPFTTKQFGMAKMLIGKLGSKWEPVLRFTLQNWIEYVKDVQTKTGVKTLPQAPEIMFALKYAAEMLNMYMTHAPEAAVTKEKHHNPSAVNCNNSVKLTQAEIDEQAAYDEANKPMTLEELQAIMAADEAEEKSKKAAKDAEKAEKGKP